MNNYRLAESKLLLLRERFAAALPRRIDEIAAALDEAGPRMESVLRQFHSLAGTAGTYGLEAISSLASEGEEICDASPHAPETIDYLRSIVDDMRGALSATNVAPQLPPVARCTGRILCVDDDPAHAAYLSATLGSAGYDVRTAGGREQFRAALAEFRPDLITLDYVLPGVTGFDLARSVRSDPAYATVPIVFITGRRGVEKRIEAVAVGGDDFLTKPAAPELLLSVIGSRLRRSRSVQALIDHDGLTGVLNRPAFVRRAEAAMSDARRHGVQSALVMLDLDYFKSINDAHGHLVGDQVLVTFASLLQRSVRASDDVGRFGGEEFVLLLRGIHFDAAQKLVGRLLDEFARIPFRGAGQLPFHVTFSGGVAMFDNRCTFREWTRRADEALYAAKHNGRARIEAA